MKNQMVKGMTMLLAAVAFSLVAAVAPANAQITRMQTAYVPFEFTVGNQTLPAGRYDVSQITTGGRTISVRNRQNGESAVRLTSLLKQFEPAKRSVLVFNRVGEIYFLSEVWLGGEIEGRQVLKSKAEESRRRDVAMLSPKHHERVEIVLYGR
jgi:hypothetical protein